MAFKFGLVAELGHRSFMITVLCCSLLFHFGLLSLGQYFKLGMDFLISRGHCQQIHHLELLLQYKLEGEESDRVKKAKKHWPIYVRSHYHCYSTPVPVIVLDILSHTNSSPAAACEINFVQINRNRIKLA